MAQLLSPGVFIEEVASTTQVVGPVSTSAMGIVSWTPQGPSNVATLVTSFNQYVQTFGNFDTRSFGAYTVAAFFSNGGSQAFIVRVTPDDAAVAQALVADQVTNQTVETGDGTTVVFTETALTTALKVNKGASPIVASTLSIRWRGTGTTQTLTPTMKRDGVTPLTGTVGVLSYEGRLDPATLPAVDKQLFAVVPDGTVVITWTSGVATKTITVPAPAGGLTYATGTNVAGSTVRFDYITGRFSLLIVISETPTTAAIQGTYNPATATDTITDSAGTLIGGSLTGPGTIDYTTGAYSFTTTVGATPHVLSPLLATYEIDAWAMEPISAGAWGNSLSIQIQGSPNYFNTATATYSRFTMFVLQTGSNGNTTIQETYEDLIWNDPTSPQFFADVVNEFSSLISVDEPGANEAPGQLQGLPFSLVLAGGDDTDAGRLIQFTAGGAPVGLRTVVITYTDSLGTARTIKDDGQGNLTGDIDATYIGPTANTVNYLTGHVDFKTVAVVGPLGIKAGTLVTMVWRQAPVDAIDTVTFAGGSDGTFSTTHFNRSQFTDPALQPTYQGLYALDRLDELMQVVVPDFAGDTVVTSDLLSYAAARTNSPSGGDRFIVLTVPKGSSATSAVDWFRNKLGQYSEYAALYWPWVVIADPLTNLSLTMPAIGHVCGVYARTDNTRNVGKAPGGTVDGQLNFLTGLEIKPTQGERDYVYPNKINPLISSAQTGMAVWGVRTISLDTAWLYINARRLFMFLEKSIFESTFWIVFENNGPGLWARIKSQVASFLLALFNDGYFAGSSPDQAFFVICDNTNNTTATINQGQVIIDVGVAPNKPAEFVTFRFQQKTVSG